MYLIQNIISKEEHLYGYGHIFNHAISFFHAEQPRNGGHQNIIFDKANLPYNLIALGCACIIGSAGTAVYYLLTASPFTAGHILCMVLMGLASGLTSMVGFDKLKQSLEQINGKKG